MSHAFGRVRFADGTILHCEYDGTVDFMRSVLFDTKEEMDRYWRRNQPERPTPTPEQIEIAEAACDYGSGWTWKVKASKACKVIVEGLSPYRRHFEEELEELRSRQVGFGHQDPYVWPDDGLPDWWKP